MVGILVAVGFVAMVLAPCGVAIYSKLGSTAESRAEIPAAKAVAELPSFVVPAPPNELTAVPVAVPSLREVAQVAAREAIQAQAAAANARVEALQQASRAASKRAAAAEKLAAAAEAELVRASQAVLQAEASKAKAKEAQNGAADRDYLPHDHPSLDFPRSRVSSRRVA